jgi:hypothetical protein
MPVIHAHAAGIDVGATSHWVCVPENAVADDKTKKKEPFNTLPLLTDGLSCELKNILKP